jgi:hypothetical protein
VRRIIIIILIVLVICAGYWVWRNHTTGVSFGDGTITATNSSSSSDESTMNNGVTTDLDGNTVAHPNPSRSDDPGTINTVPVGSTGTQSSTGSTTMGTPMTSATPPQPSPVSAPGGLTARAPVLGPRGPIPKSDSLSPNAPNGVGFAGTGKYMWYRQGDITYRVNSDTGARCIAFATMQQWSRPIVYQNGCDSRG